MDDRWGHRDLRIQVPRTHEALLIGAGQSRGLSSKYHDCVCESPVRSEMGLRRLAVSVESGPRDSPNSHLAEKATWNPGSIALTVGRRGCGDHRQLTSGTHPEIELPPTGL